MKNNEPSIIVLDRMVIASARQYILKELPDGINFKYHGKLMRTITHPTYNTGGLNTDKQMRPCLNLRSLKEEGVAYGETVITV